jgi:hypothetical protein
MRAHCRPHTLVPRRTTEKDAGLRVRMSTEPYAVAQRLMCVVSQAAPEGRKTLA